MISQLSQLGFGEQPISQDNQIDENDIDQSKLENQ